MRQGLQTFAEAPASRYDLSQFIIIFYIMTTGY